jgi:hypothetical protein
MRYTLRHAIAAVAALSLLLLCGRGSRMMRTGRRRCG